MIVTKINTHGVQPPLLNRLAWRLGEWEQLTGNSRTTTYRHIKDGDLKIIRVVGTSIA
jgi:hypothetical protein